MESVWKEAILVGGAFAIACFVLYQVCSTIIKTISHDGSKLEPKQIFTIIIIIIFVCVLVILIGSFLFLNTNTNNPSENTNKNGQDSYLTNRELELLRYIEDPKLYDLLINTEKPPIELYNLSHGTNMHIKTCSDFKEKDFDEFVWEPKPVFFARDIEKSLNKKVIEKDNLVISSKTIYKKMPAAVLWSELLGATPFYSDSKMTILPPCLKKLSVQELYAPTEEAVRFTYSIALEFKIEYSGKTKNGFVESKVVKIADFKFSEKVFTSLEWPLKSHFPKLLWNGISPEKDFSTRTNEVGGYGRFPLNRFTQSTLSIPDLVENTELQFDKGQLKNVELMLEYRVNLLKENIK